MTALDRPQQIKLEAFYMRVCSVEPIRKQCCPSSDKGHVDELFCKCLHMAESVIYFTKE